MQVSSGGVSLSSELYSSNGVIRGADVMSNSGNSFRRGYQRAGAAGNNVVIQLWNPAGSGKTLFVDEVLAQLGAAGACYIFVDSTMATNLIGAWYNNKAGGANGSAEVRWDDGLAWTTQQQILVTSITAAPFLFPLEMPFTIPENKGLSVFCVPLATTLAATFAGREFTV